MKYKGGLRPKILASIAPLEIRNCAALVNKCRIADDYTKRLASKRSEAYKRKQASQGAQPQ